MSFLPTHRPRRVAVFRALQLGDLLCSVPAWRALRTACPEAHITLVSLPWARDLAARLDAFDDFVEFPGHPALPERDCAPKAFDALVTAMRAREFDLALQMHGSGASTNAIVAAFGAVRTGGFHPEGTASPDAETFVPWREDGTHEIHRHLDLVAHLGAPARGEQLELPVTDAEHRAAQSLLVELGLPGRAFACIHPGARFPSRRWPTARFAAVGDALAAAGLAVLLTGTRDEVPLAREVARRMRHAAIDLSGRTTLGVLAALVARARLVICNDTGMSHVASATGTASVVVCSGADVHRWRPLGARHRVLAHPVPCRPCTHRVCPTGHECALAITPDAVLAEARALLARPRETQRAAA
jgi:ADP-heptose:LPS heptosyltransferase